MERPFNKRLFIVIFIVTFFVAPIRGTVQVLHTRELGIKTQTAFFGGLILLTEFLDRTLTPGANVQFFSYINYVPNFAWLLFISFISAFFLTKLLSGRVNSTGENLLNFSYNKKLLVSSVITTALTASFYYLLSFLLTSKIVNATIPNSRRFLQSSLALLAVITALLIISYFVAYKRCGFQTKLQKVIFTVQTVIISAAIFAVTIIVLI